MQKNFLIATLITAMAPIFAADMGQMPNVRTWETMSMPKAYEVATMLLGDSDGITLTEKQIGELDTAIDQDCDVARRTVQGVAKALQWCFNGLRPKLAQDPDTLRLCKKHMHTAGQFLAFMYRMNNEEKQKMSGITTIVKTKGNAHTTVYMLDGKPFFEWTRDKKHDRSRRKGNRRRPHPEDMMAEQN
jgi:hypothetical protein